MRKYSPTAAMLASLVFATSVTALEKTSVRIGDTGRAESWNAGTSCSIAYYNTCTGWVWTWSGWSPNEQLGVSFDPCCGSGSTLVSNWMFVWTSAPSGYGFTGEIGVYDTDASLCPIGAPLATQAFLPGSGWNQYVWNTTVGSRYVVQVTNGPGTGNPLAFASDHPAAGPTGPAAAGGCFPTSRPNRSFYYGSTSTPVCPGSSLNDGINDAQLLWDASHTNCPLPVEQQTWGQIKSLYR